MNKKINRQKILKILIFIFVATLVIISVKKALPKTKADEKVATKINVTYKPGEGTGSEITTSQTVYAKQTKGTNDYTDNKIVLYENGEKTEDGKTIQFDGGTTTYNSKTYEKVLTGWRLDSVTQNGTKITQFVKPVNENYANPDDAAKDISTVYAQKGWYIVPNGVTSIEVTAMYGRAIYVRSPYDTMYYDEYHIFYYGVNSDGKTSTNGEAQEKSSDNNFGTSPDDAVATLKKAYELITASSDLTVYDTIFVLCGNLYEINYNTVGSSFATGTAGTYKKYTSGYFGYNSSATKPVTITSVKGQKYTLYAGAPSYDYTNSSSLRLDNFKLSNIPTSNFKDIHDNDITISTYAISRQFNFAAGLTFETTENLESDAVSQFRCGSSSHSKFNGGQWNPVHSYSAATATLSVESYVQIGGTSNISYVSIGACFNSSNSESYITNPFSINVTGGRITTGIYGTGYVQGSSVKGNVNIYISGGNISNIYGAGYGSVYANGNEKGDVNLVIYNGTIGTIYGAGQFYTSKIYGNVNIDIKNATITGNIYGGGKGGKVEGNVTLNINGCKVSGTVFGGGYGLTDIVSFNIVYSTTATSSGWNTAVSNFNNVASSNKTVNWEKAPNGFPIYDESKKQIVTRRYHSTYTSNKTYYLYEGGISQSLTLAEVNGNVTLNITNSTINQSVYGGGSIAVVEKGINVTVENSTVSGNIYGGGDGMTVPGKVDLYSPITGTYTALKESQADSNRKIGSFTWTNDTDIFTYFQGIYDGVNKVIYNADNTTTSFDSLGVEAQKVIQKYGNQQLVYSADASRLGYVDGDITLTVKNTNVTANTSIYGGGNAGSVGGTTTVTIEGIEGKELFGGSYSGHIGGDTNITVNSGKFQNIFGGCDQSYVEGSTTVNVGKNDNISTNSTTVTGIVYGGGRGVVPAGEKDASNYETVKKSSNVTIAGIYTNVGNYGSITLGKVTGDVNVNFLNYWSGNDLAKYKTMNGIDRATTVRFTDSYVLLQNQDENGNLVGIQAIDNLVIPEGSGIKISADGTIGGDFRGGGELYLDSEVCLTVKGNISGTTTLILNPLLYDVDGHQKNEIFGTIENPYLKVEQGSLATENEAASQELISGEAKYTILCKKIGGVSYYYIADTIEILDTIDTVSTSVTGRKYTGTLNQEKEIYMLNNEAFTTEITSKFELTDNSQSHDKYKNISEKFGIKIDEKTYVELPIGTEIIMMEDGKYYTYIVKQSGISSIMLSEFVDENGTKYPKSFNIRDVGEANSNETSGDITYTYTQNIRFIINFANCENKIMTEPRCYTMINFIDGYNADGSEKTLDDTQTSATNILHIKKRDFSYNYTLDRNEYKANEIININETIKIEELTEVKQEMPRVLYMIVRLARNDGTNYKIIYIPEGTKIALDNKTAELVENGVYQTNFINVTNAEVNNKIRVSIDMSEVLEQYMLDKGDYKIITELAYGENGILESVVQARLQIPIKIIEEDDIHKYGLKAEIVEESGVAKDKLQLIEKENETRRININYDGQNQGEKVKIKILEKTGKFEYTDITQNKSIVAEKDSKEITEISSLSENQEITLKFNSNIKKGTYRIVFELYDEFDLKITESYANFIVLK